MKNFIAFNFCDNDFHSSLQQAVNFLVENVDFSTMSITDLHGSVAEAASAFQILAAVANRREVRSSREYIFDNMSVDLYNSLDEIKNGEGYVIDTNLMTVSYFGY